MVSQPSPDSGPTLHSLESQVVDQQLLRETPTHRSTLVHVACPRASDGEVESQVEALVER